MKYLLHPTLLLCALSSIFAQDSDTFEVGIKETPPFTIKDANGHWSGPSVWLIEKILGDLGKTPVYREMGLAEVLTALENDQVDAGIAALSITSEREEKIDFTHAFFESGIGVAIEDSRGKIGLMVLKNLFSLQFFSAVFSLLLLLAIVGMFVWLAERKRNPGEFGGRPLKGIGNGLWWSAVTMTTVGFGDKAPRTFLGRSLAIIWMFMAIIIISGFTAGFASSLTRDSLSSRVENVRDLANVRTATVAGSTSAEWLASLRVPFRTSDSIEKLLKELDGGRWQAVVFDKPVLEYYVARDDLRHVDVLKTTFTRENYGIGLPQNSPYGEKIDVLLLRYTSTDEWENELYRVLNAKP